MIEFTVYGKPEPQGSAKAFIPKGWKRAIVTSDNVKLKPWRQQVSGAALDAVKGLDLPAFRANTPMFIAVKFFFQRPASATIKARPGMTVKPDGDKVLRAILDAITGILVHDDAQFVELHVSKQYGVPRVEIQVAESQIVDERISPAVRVGTLFEAEALSV
jgi:crossover junction endodeoxyribonuclease RusA